MQAQGIIMQHLQPAMCRAISSSATAAAAAPALVTSGGLGSIFGIGSRVSVPLSEALPGVVAPTKGAPPPAKVEAKTAKLPTSGVKVTAIDAASPVASFALTVAGGSAAPGAPAGAAKLLEALAFKSTSNRTTFRLTRELEKLGASGVAKASRESVTYSIEVPRVNAAEAVEILVDSVLNARFTFWETRDTLATVKDQLAAALKDPAVALSETLHAAAFDGGLAAPLFADPSLLSGLDSAAVKAFVTSTLHPSALSLAGASVDLSALTSYADPLIAASSAAAPAASSGAYVGGSLSVLAQASPLLHAAIAIEVAGGASSVKSAATAAVVKALLDNSRPVIPYRDVGATAFQPFSHVYTSTGLVGFSASAAPSKGAALVDEMVAKVRSLAAPVSADALARGKALATASFRASTATTAGLLAAADSIVTFPAAVAAVTAADVAAFVKAGLKKPTFVTYGSTFIRQDAVAKKLIA